jgi:AraC-like DNA-binding protein
MEIRQLSQRVSQLTPRNADNADQSITLAPRLELLDLVRPTAFEVTLYEPVLCVILNGRKDVIVGEDSIPLQAGDFILISHDIIIDARISEAPYRALVVDIDMNLLRSIWIESESMMADATQARAVTVNRVDAPLAEALARYLAAIASPIDAKVLGPLALKEIHYRLLSSPYGGMLKMLVQHNSPAGAIARAIAHIRQDFRKAISVPSLAQHVGMSVATFHKHFKAVTLATPLQYQKDLRLLEARRVLQSGLASVSTAAYDVGYESAPQFSREYSRKFGVPPSQHLVETSLRRGA